MRNSVAKALRNRVYGTFGHRARDYQARTYDNWVWAIFKEGEDFRIDRFPRINKKETNEEVAEKMIPNFTKLIMAWNPITIRDFGPRAVYKLVKKHYKRGQYEEMEAFFK